MASAINRDSLRKRAAQAYLANATFANWQALMELGFNGDEPPVPSQIKSERLRIVPFKRVVHVVAARRLTDLELKAVGLSLMEELKNFEEDREKWPSFDVYFGFRLYRAAMLFHLDEDDMHKLKDFVVTLVLDKLA